MKSMIYIIISGIVGFVIGFVLRCHIEANKFILASWENSPIVIVCEDSQITPYRIAKAIEWWGIRGHEIEYYHFDNSGVLCGKGFFVNGFIFIRATGDIDPSFYATTTRLAIAGEMKSASIHLPNKHKYMPRLLEHELGHALGFTHIEKLGHMMNPIHENGGEKFWIPD